MGRRPCGDDVVAVLTSRVRQEEKQLLAALDRRRVPYEHLRDTELVMRVDAPMPYRLVLMRSLSQTRRLAASRLFEGWGVPVYNSAHVIATCDDKVATAAALVRAGIPMPRTAVALAPDAGVAAIRAVGFPAVTKPTNGSWGRLVARVNDDDAAEGIVAHKARLASAAQHVVLAQRFVDGSDVRAVVVGGRVIGAMRRYGTGLATNVALGARTEAIPVTNELEWLATAAAEAVGGTPGAVAVDMLQAESGTLLVTEVNSTVEFCGFAAATGVDVADHIVAHALDEQPC